MNPKIKFNGCKFLLQNIYEKIEYDSSALMWADADSSINKLYDFYETTYGNKLSLHLKLIQHLRVKVHYFQVFYKLLKN